MSRAVRAAKDAANVRALSAERAAHYLVEKGKVQFEDCS